MLIAMLSSTLLMRSSLCSPNRLTATDANAGLQTARERAHDNWPDVAVGNFLYRYSVTTISMNAANNSVSPNLRRRCS